MTRAPLAIVLVLLAVNAFGQDRPRIYIDEIKSPDVFTAERYRLLLGEHLRRLKNIDVVLDRSRATLIVAGVGEVERSDSSSFRGSQFGQFGAVSGGSGVTSNALLSIQITDAVTGDVAFVGNESTNGTKQLGATETAVDSIVKEIKKRFRWK